MPTYEVVVQATITKTYTITAQTRDEAICDAHFQFNPQTDEFDFVPETIKKITVSTRKLGE